MTLSTGEGPSVRPGGLTLEPELKTIYLLPLGPGDSREPLCQSQAPGSVW